MVEDTYPQQGDGVTKAPKLQYALNQFDDDEFSWAVELERVVVAEGCERSLAEAKDAIAAVAKQRGVDPASMERLPF